MNTVLAQSTVHVLLAPFLQDMHVATVNKDIERQQSYLDKMKAEVR